MENPNAESYFSMCKGPKRSEANLQKNYCKWLKEHFPGIMIRPGMEGVHLSATEADYYSSCASDDHYPDVMLYEPRGGLVGFAIELKRDHNTLYTKKGTIRQNKHLMDQIETLERLAQRKWGTAIAGSLQEAIEKTIQYMSLSK